MGALSRTAFLLFPCFLFAQNALPPLPPGFFATSSLVTASAHWVAGYSFTGVDYDVILLSYEPASLQLLRKFPLTLPGNQIAASVSQAPDGTIVLGAWTDATRPSAFLVLRIDPATGVILSSTPYDPSGQLLPPTPTLSLQAFTPILRNELPPAAAASDLPLPLAAAPSTAASCVPGIDPTPADCDTVLVEDTVTAGSLGGRTPIILIEDAWTTTSVASPNRTPWLSLLTAFGATPQFVSQFKVFRFHYLTGKYTTWELSRALRNHLDNLINSYPEYDTRFSLIGHGLGGLIARSYMDHHWHWSGSGTSPYRARRAGERVSKAFTLATPHSGTPLLAHDTAIAAFWTAQGCTSCANLTEYANGLSSISPTFDHKLYTYWGYLGTSATITSFAHSSIGDLATQNGWGTLLERLVTANWNLSSAVLTLSSDGYIPGDSAALPNRSPAKRVACPAYDHTLMLYGNTSTCSTGATLFGSLLADLGTPNYGTNPISPPALSPPASSPNCVATLTPAAANHSYTSATGSVTVSANCSWQVRSFAPWISITATTSGSFAYLIETNPNPLPRTGIVSITGPANPVYFYITQDSVTGACTYDLAPNFRSYSSSSAADTLTVIAPTACPWTPSVDTSWVAISPSTAQNGTKPISYSLAANGGGSARYGSITVTPQSGSPMIMQLTQLPAASACTYTLGSYLGYFASSNGAGLFTIQTQAGCPWSLVSDPSWISITSAASGVGSASVTYSLPASTATRSGNITVLAGSSTLQFQIVQDAPAATAPDINLPSTTVAFGNSLVDKPMYQAIAVQNLGQATLYPSDIVQVSGQPGFRVETPLSPILPGETRYAVLSFTPGSQIAYTATFRISSNDPDEAAVDFTVTGTGTGNSAASNLIVGPGTVSFGDVPLGAIAEIPISVQNVDTSTISLTYNWTQSGDFKVLNAPATLTAGAAAILRLRLAPTSTGAKSASFRVTSSGSGAPSYTVTLSANAISSTSSTFQASRTIPLSGSGTPSRLSVSPTKAYVSRTNPAAFSIVDLAGGSSSNVSFSLYTSANPGQPAFSSARAFVPLSNLGSNGQVAVVDLTTNTLSQYVAAGTEPFGAFVADSLLYVSYANCPTGSSLSTVKTYDVATLAGQSTYLAGKVANWLAFDASTNRIVASNAGCGATDPVAGLTMIDTAGQYLVATKPLRQAPVAVAAYGGRAYVNTGQTLEVIDLSSMELLASVPIPEPSSGAAAGPAYVYVLNTGTGVVTAIDRSTNRIAGSITVAGATAIAADGASDKAYVTTASSIVIVSPIQPSFTLGCTPSAIADRSAACTVTTQDGFSSAVTLGCGTTPGLSCIWSPAAVSGSGTSLLTLSGVVASGHFPVYVRALAGTATRTRVLSLTVPTCAFATGGPPSTIPTIGGTFSISVSSPGGCAWTAQSNSSWISISGGASSSGTSSAIFAVSPNPSPAPRSGSVTVAGTLINIAQDGVSCSIALGSTSGYAGAGGGDQSVSVIASGSGCAWTAASNVSWISIVSGASGTGSGSVNFSIASYRAAGTRSGSLTIAGQTFTVDQYGVFPPNRNATFVFRDPYRSLTLASFGSSSFKRLGGVFDSEPASAQDQQGNTYLIAYDRWGGTYGTIFDAGTNTQGNWYYGGGVFIGSPALTVATNGIAYAVGRDQWNGYWIATFTRAGFSPWQYIGGIFITDPSVSASPDGCIYIVGKDRWNGLYTGYLEPGVGWHDWSYVGAIVKGKPSITVGTDTVAYITMRDRWDSIYMVRIHHGTILGWTYCGGILEQDPITVADGRGRIFVAGKVPGSVTFYGQYIEGAVNGWLGWAQSGGVLDGMAAAELDGDLALFGRDKAGGHWWYRLSTNQWTSGGNANGSFGELSGSPR
ncbi:MAG: choice-of-anchor D domain-containing protein [Bryobacterales bacterium]|nr:choice-of-anchor D domain-containing protein [Bryobacterales bacterium]